MYCKPSVSSLKKCLKTRSILSSTQSALSIENFDMVLIDLWMVFTVKPPNCLNELLLAAVIWVISRESKYASLRTRISYSGEGGIRTLGGPEPTTVFETVPFNHSGTSPRGITYQVYQCLVMRWRRDYNLNFGLTTVLRLNASLDNRLPACSHRTVFGSMPWQAFPPHERERLSWSYP